MGEVGKVRALKGQMAEVHIPKSEACKGCHVCAFEAIQKEMVLFAQNECGAQEGDLVEVTIEKSGQASASLIVYGIPLLFFVAGILVFSRFFTEGWTMAASLALTAVGFLIVHVLSQKLDRSACLPKVTRIVHPSQQAPEALS